MREAGSRQPEARRAAETRGSSAFRILASGFWLLASVVAAGCASQSPATQPSDDITARQEQALRDPFSYSPNPKKPDNTVSGNGEFDKDAIKRDLNHVLDP